MKYSRTTIYLALFFFLFFSFVVGLEIYLSKSDDLHVVFLDVGQGDAIFIYQGTKQVLIDGGRDSELLLERLGSFMPFWDKRIEVVIATHPDADHIGGLLGLADSYEIGSYMTNGMIGESDLSRAFQVNADRINGGVVLALVGTKIQFAQDAEITILWPGLHVSDSRNTNDGSVVAKLTYGEHTFLFTGDIPQKMESKIEIAGKVDVLKVSHHGSKSSTGDVFLDAIQPNDAVISVGKNSYGHPAKEVLDRLSKRHIRIIRTDERGSVEYVCKKNVEKCIIDVSK